MTNDKIYSKRLNTTKCFLRWLKIVELDNKSKSFCNEKMINMDKNAYNCLHFKLRNLLKMTIYIYLKRLNTTKCCLRWLKMAKLENNRKGVFLMRK